ncbi:MAG TPA: D-glycero-beta-D-manno-heptose-7-phosphate kinase [Nitrospiria bacterium]|jgi:D-beta-D-heptose 7-phosphate kinase/D-beta-D-heptose 1-phosphate adenosyltransferase|nr:D-glycero-beta-D-manno-heptose-7-phosphate kinase [Nitrospiria bacterium]
MNTSPHPHEPDRVERLVQYCQRFPKVRLMVVGDVMLDHYIWGGVDRISPEAPVPVVAVSNESIHLGGAANVAHNVVSLGGKVELCGVIGKDDFGGRILRELKRLKIGTEGLRVDPDRPTTKKTRVIAHNQQVVRFDREQRLAVSEKIRRALFEFIGRRIRRVDGVVVSDYSKGVITGELMKDLIGLAQHHGVPIIVDPKVGHMSYYKGVQVITPNTIEAFGAAGLETRSEEDLMRAGQILLERLECRAVLITRGEHGMSLFEKDGKVTHIPTVAREVYDVTGAGDTVIATLALAMGAGAEMRDAALLANYAAGIVVGIVGTAPVQRARLAQVLRERTSS